MRLASATLSSGCAAMMNTADSLSTHRQPLDRVLAAIADPTRRAILERLRRGEATVTDLARPFAFSLNAVSKHLQVLERAGLMRRSVRGREHHCALDAGALRDAAQWIERYRSFWESGLDGLQAYLKRRAKAPRKRSKR
jgi:DNA-binding transcriptional ArsR family regulator